VVRRIAYLEERLRPDGDERPCGYGRRSGGNSVFHGKSFPAGVGGSACIGAGIGIGFIIGANGRACIGVSFSHSLSVGACTDISIGAGIGFGFIIGIGGSACIGTSIGAGLSHSLSVGV
jgi:hypothetical protein